MSTIRTLGQPKTVGELKRLIENYNDDTPFGFRQQPMQDLVEEKIGYDIFVSFREPAKLPADDLCSCKVPQKSKIGNFCHRCKKHVY